MISPSSDRPLYQRIADDLREHIKNGTYPPGSPLPSERHLRQAYSAGQHAIRAALRVLVAEGAVVKQTGVLTRVRDTPTMSLAHYPPGHRVRARPATAAERAEWELPAGAWVLTVVEAATGLEVEAYPADRTELEQTHPGE
jgi:DNA-binding FadR family transcriptional regulator